MSNTKELNIESVAASHEEVTLVDGTVFPSAELMMEVNQINCSPKLSNSGVPREKRINEHALDFLKEQKAHKLIVRLDIGDDIVQLLLNEIKKLSVEVEGLRAKLNRIA